MSDIEYYYKKIIAYDLINKFHYKNVKKIPKVKEIVLNYNSKNPELKELVASLISLKLLSTDKNIVLTKAKKSNISIRIKIGQPVGCKITLKNKKMYEFFSKLLSEILPNLKNLKETKLNKKKYQTKNFSFTLKLETNFYLFNSLPPLNINIITNTTTKKELFFLLNAFKIIAI